MIPLDVLFDRPDELNPAYNLYPDARPDENGNFPDNHSERVLEVPGQLW
jgi:hypothetical protein